MKIYAQAYWDLSKKFQDWYITPSLSFVIDKQCEEFGYKSYGVFFNWLKIAAYVDFEFEIKKQK